MIPYGRQSINRQDIQTVVNVLKSGWITQGPNILEFEKSLAKYCGARYAVAVSHGTPALHMAYLAADIKKGDEVITTPNTFAATANMLMAVGAKPVFSDIRLDTYNIDETKIEKLITKKTKAIVPIDFAGHPCEMRPIQKIAKKYNLLVIEDSCQSLGAKYKNKKVGSLADMTVFSFHPVKAITTGEGGAILTNNKTFYQKFISLRNHGIHKDNKGKNVMTELGYNYRITDMGAALGISQLKRLNNFIKKRRQVVKWYQEELDNIKEIILPQEIFNNYSGWHIYVIRVRRPKLRDALAKYLKDNGVGVNFHFPAVYSHPYYRQHGYKNIRLPNTELYHTACITLPLYPDLKKTEVKHVADIIKRFFNKD